MKHSVPFAVAVLAANSFTSVFAQTWCGKNYMANQTVVPPGGQFQLPANSTEPLLAFRCSPVFRPYLEQDAKHAAVVIDTPIVYQYIQGASPISLTASGSNSSGSECDGLGTVEVTISIGDQVFAKEDVPLNVTGYEVSLDISSLIAQKSQYNVTCNAAYQAETSSSSPTTQQFSTNTSLLYLPDTNGSVVKTDLRTGTLLVRPVNDSGGSFEPFIPLGFYVSFDQYLVHNLSLIDSLKSQGFNTIHPIPPYDNVTAFQQVLHKSVELGLYLVFDMRSVYQNLTAVAQLIDDFSSLPNLLLWETAHEPDGNADPFNAAHDTYDLIYQMDGYHPVSIVLNCQDYNFAPYVEGADIVLEDAYPFGINATYSSVWHTPCTPDFGRCGCDNCWTASSLDIRDRIQSFKERLNILGYDRSKTVWTIPQAFGTGAPFWNATPSGAQWSGIDLTSFNHGATGSISFQYPPTNSTSPGTSIAVTAPNVNPIIAASIQPFLVDPDATYESFFIDDVDAGLWYNGTAYLLLVVNLNNTAGTFVPWSAVGLGTVTTNATSQVQRLFSVFQTTNATGMIFKPNGIGMYTATPPK